MITVVDAERLLDHFDEVDDLTELGIGRDDDDTRTIADLIVDQIEFADLLVITKSDLVSDDELARVTALARTLNPDAVIEIAEHGRVPLDVLFDTHRFDPERTGTAPGWAAVLNGDPVPETEEYGISHFVYRSRWPFHPERLYEALTETTWDGVLRSKGFFWVASRPDIQAVWHQAGSGVSLEPVAPWLAVMDRDDWDLTDDELVAVDARWDPLVGDRLTELVFIGTDMDPGAIVATLDACVLTPDEIALGFDGWATFADPLPEWG